jgi:putative DNA primase/helicase
VGGKKNAQGATAGARRQVLDDALVAGRLMAHGMARYQFQSHGERSYFVKVLTQRGERTVWGKDLKRAVEESVTKVTVGDIVGLRRTAREIVNVSPSDAAGRDSSDKQETRRAYRNRWEVEKVAFFAQRTRLARQLRDEQLEASAAVRERPELKSTFLTLRAAQEFVERRVKDPGDRKRFMSLVKEAIEGSIRRGEPMPTERLRGVLTDPQPKIKGRTR